MTDNNSGKLRVVSNRYRILEKVGSGSFGKLYSAIDTVDGQRVAIKMERSNSRHPQLRFEYKIYRILRGNPGIAKVYNYVEEFHHNSLVIELLGSSLEDMFNRCYRRFNLKTVLLLADQMIQRLEFLHSRCFIHRDIKPENFLVGTELKSDCLYIIDFGLAKKFKSSTTGMHIAYRDDKSLTGTARYASTNAHLGIEQSRRDDLESLGYVLLYFLRGNLPWQGLQASNKKEKYQKIAEKKIATSVELLCQGFPNEFVLYLSYCRSLKFDKRPDYNYLRQIFLVLYRNMNFSNDSKFQWMECEV